MEKIIEIKHLKKYFKEVKAVDDLTFSVKKGELFSFLGVNGAGKSTTISMISGTLQKDSGEIVIAGHNIENAKKSILNDIGVVFQTSVLDNSLSVKDNLTTKAALYGLSKEATKKRIAELAKMLEFDDLLTRTVGKLSGGQKRRIDVARALINEPKILILDEPTTGLDPQTRKTLWKVIDDCRKNKGMTVFLTTHYMEEAAESDYIVILDAGKIVAEGTPLELKNTYTGDFVTVYGVQEEAVKKLGLNYVKIKDAYRISVKNTQEAKELIVGNGDLFNDFEITKGKMDDVFLSVTGKKLVGGN